ncbi:uncharacterized protein VICG_01768 [Vittaforma corneae ATCC 50505]|uniref:Uncharacterized protein n=1 Tax=Vittaforma corneae (strain ATCC 50505) TaxID=993615 RepID=L2GKM8_VITCO|nr:uncharacterized protein VICG_01768 [Vittaforma corneae ATCC 50505]ELA41169.1 hypothetical protein VICG_01768 [Vittaforma corneae ATCC 50505]
MRFASVLFICLAAATFSSLSNTAESWYTSASTTVHSRLGAVDAYFKKLTATYFDCLKVFFSSMRNEITRRQLNKPMHSMKEFLDRMRSYVLKGRRIVEEEKKIEVEEQEEKERKRKEEEKSEL